MRRTSPAPASGVRSRGRGSAPARAAGLCFVALAAGPGPAPAAAQDAAAPARPCDALEPHRRFDFWIGEWTVYDAEGNRLGTNSITRPEQECMLVERWESATGNHGTSINYFDPGTERWVQYWVAAASMLDLHGRFEDGAMRMEGRARSIRSPGAEGVRTRGTWTPLEDGRVRQTFERWNEETGEWQVTFDGYYVRDDTPDGRNP